jgi:hypothetical protein
MTDPDIERQRWLDYIGKLNDRALQRQRASGFTTWAIVGVLVWLFSQVLTRIDILITDSHARSIHLLAVTEVFVLASFGFLLFLAAGLFRSAGNDLRLRTELDSRFGSFVSRVQIPLLTLLIGCLSIFSAMHANLYSLSAWPFWALGVFSIISCIGVVRGATVLHKKRRRHSGELPELSFVPPLHRLGAFIFGVFLLVVLGISLVPVFEAIPKITGQAQVDILKWSFYVVLLAFLIELLWLRSARSAFTDFLFDLERRIVLQGLSADEIR